MVKPTTQHPMAMVSDVSLDSFSLAAYAVPGTREPVRQPTIHETGGIGGYSPFADFIAENHILRAKPIISYPG
jgi:hypothetical protein